MQPRTQQERYTGCCILKPDSVSHQIVCSPYGNISDPLYVTINESTSDPLYVTINEFQMSTKLTARKRYLPRVKAGVTEFKKLSGVRKTFDLLI